MTAIFDESVDSVGQIVLIDGCPPQNFKKILKAM